MRIDIVYTIHYDITMKTIRYCTFNVRLRGGRDEIVVVKGNF